MIEGLEILLIAAFVVGLTIMALVDILRNEFSGNNKIVWVLVVLLLNFFGAILYFVIGRKQKISEPVRIIFLYKKSVNKASLIVY